MGPRLPWWRVLGPAETSTHPGAPTGPRAPGGPLMARTAALMYAGGAFIGLAENYIPGGPAYDPGPGFVALLLAVGLAWHGPRLPRWLFALLGPIGTILMAISMADSPGPGDGAVVYVWPVLWETYFFGRTGAAAVVACTGVAHAMALWALPPGNGFADRWFDVMTSMTLTAVVVLALVRRNRELVDRLAAESRTDPLTRLLNRRGFEERAALELARARRDRSSVALASIDIDFFKKVNDAWGHAVGDRVLEHLGSVLSAHAREIDVVARVGGEEFVVLLPGATSATARDFTERVRQALASGSPPGVPDVKVSAGVAAHKAPVDLELLRERADSALYRAKQSGRDRTVDLGEVADPAMLT